MLDLPRGDSNARLIAHDECGVTFAKRTTADGLEAQGDERLTVDEFIVMLHLSKAFTRIRHYGFVSMAAPPSRCLRELLVFLPGATEFPQSKKAAGRSYGLAATALAAGA